MKKKKVKSIIICLFLLLLIIVAILVMFILKLRTDSDELLETNGVSILKNEPSSIEEVLEKYNCRYIDTIDNKIYLRFEKNLYENNGVSNRDYFEAIIEELKPFFDTDFSLIDNDKNIIINVSLKNDKIIINEKEDFYENTDGKTYIQLENIEIAEKTRMIIQSDELSFAAINGMYIDEELLEKLGEQDEVQDSEDYISYQNGNVKISKFKNANRIKNIIFSNDYKNEIMSGIDTDTSLEKIKEKYPNVSFGSVREGYLAYRTEDVYMFIYPDEISVYGYYYGTNTKLENFMEDYLENKDLELFKKRMVVSFDYFDEYKYDEQTKSLYLSYPSLGLEININNNTNEITLYNNYYFTEKSKKWVNEGLIKLNSNVDYIEKVEKERIDKN